jgi:hypothetical protein
MLLALPSTSTPATSSSSYESYETKAFTVEAQSNNQTPNASDNNNVDDDASFLSRVTSDNKAFTEFLRQQELENSQQQSSEGATQVFEDSVEKSISQNLAATLHPEASKEKNSANELD